MKFEFNSLIAFIGAIASFAWGGYPLGIQILVYFAIADYITGMVSAAKAHELSSKIGFFGIVKKMLMFLLCSVAFKIDGLIGASGLLFNGVIFWYVGNEGLSIIENSIEMGLKVPKRLKDAIDALLAEDDEDGSQTL